MKDNKFYTSYFIFAAEIINKDKLLSFIKRYNIHFRDYDIIKLSNDNLIPLTPGKNYLTIARYTSTKTKGELNIFTSNSCLKYNIEENKEYFVYEFTGNEDYGFFNDAISELQKDYKINQITLSDDYFKGLVPDLLKDFNRTTLFLKNSKYISGIQA